MTILDWSHCSAVERSADKMSGAWVFRRTRVPVQALFQNLEGGSTVAEFLAWFPGVGREQVLAVLAFAEQSRASTEAVDDAESVTPHDVVTRIQATPPNPAQFRAATANLADALRAAPGDPGFDAAGDYCS